LRERRLLIRWFGVRVPGGLPNANNELAPTRRTDFSSDGLVHGSFQLVRNRQQRGRRVTRARDSVMRQVTALRGFRSEMLLRGTSSTTVRLTSTVAKVSVQKPASDERCDGQCVVVPSVTTPATALKAMCRRAIGNHPSDSVESNVSSCGDDHSSTSRRRR
jgi:hypothetical protein